MKCPFCAEDWDYVESSLMMKVAEKDTRIEELESECKEANARIAELEAELIAISTQLAATEMFK